MMFDYTKSIAVVIRDAFSTIKPKTHLNSKDFEQAANLRKYISEGHKVEVQKGMHLCLDSERQGD